MKFPFDFRERQTDLEVYYTAASLIQGHHGEDIYDGADTGVDPQQRFADENSIFAKEALAHGIHAMFLYVYPPSLAYGIVPLAGFRISEATILWKISNWIALLAMSVLLANLLGMRFLSFGSLCVALFLFAYRPTLECFYFGQITILLTLLEVGGMFLYVRGYKTSSALLFAVSTAIKMTPAIVIVPLIAWRDWKTLRAFAFWCAGIIVLLCLPDGGRLMFLFFLHVLPSMSSGIVYIDNKSLSTGVQVFWLAIRHGGPTKWLGMAAKAFGVLTVIYSGYLCRSNSNEDRSGNRVEVLSLFWLLSCCVAPVSWRHAYVCSAPALAILFKRMLEGRARIVEALLLTGFTLSVSSFGFAMLARSTGSPIVTAWATCTPVLGIAVILLELGRLRTEKQAVPGAGGVVRFQSAT